MNILYLLLAILKTMGVVFLIVILVLLFIIILILVIPLKYRLYINREEILIIDTHINWLYPLISFKYLYHGNEVSGSELMLCGKKILPKKDKRVKKLKVKKRKHNNSQLNKGDTKIEIPPKEPINKDDYGPDRHRNKESTYLGKTYISKVRKIIKDINSYQYKKELLVNTITYVRKIILYIMPSTLYIELEIGKDDPASTGKLIGAISAFYPIYYSFANIRGNYEEECLRGIIVANGKFTLGNLLYETIRYARLDSIKEIVKFIKKNREDEEDGRKVSK